MLLEFDRVCFRYSGLGQVDSQNQLQEISFRFESHEALGIVGQGGAGKTTLLQMITGLEKPNSGRVCVDQQNIHQKKYPLAQLRQKIGLVFQFPESQLFEMTVREDVAYGPRNLGLSADAIEQRVQAALDQMELPAEQFQNRDIHHLSQGEKRRVAIAGILAMQPEVLVLDEPTAGLDPHATRQLVAILGKLRASGKHGLIIVSHDMEFLTEVIDRLIVLEQGKIMMDFALTDLPNVLDKLPSHLALPRPMRLAQHLRKLGIAIPDSALTRAQVLRALTELSTDQ
ncbi:ATP-binding cassette domain-containing protein [candidate division KSB1 bacterium]|nr:ATP-binding cassette domain-containing protein [candidate division KSB1 bacterium]